MVRIIMSIPVDIDNHFFTSMSIGLLHYLQKKKLKCKFFKPISQIENYDFNHTNQILKKYSNIESIDSLNINKIEVFNNDIEYNNIINLIIKKYYENKNNTDVIFIEGLIPVYVKELMFDLNCKIANIFNVEIIFITSILSKNKNFKKIKSKIDIIFKKKIYNYNSRSVFFFIKEIFQKRYFNIFFKNLNNFELNNIQNKTIHQNNIFSITEEKITYIPWLKNNIFGINLKEIFNYLNCNVINLIEKNRIKYIIFFDKNFFLKEKFFLQSLIIFSIKNKKILEKIYNFLSKKIFFNALLFIDFQKKNKIYNNIIFNKIIKIAIKKNITILYLEDNICQINLKLVNFYKYDFPIQDKKLILNIINYISQHIPKNFHYKKYLNYKFYISPYIFKYNLVERASKIRKTILLPEGNELRIIQAASICSYQKIANCVLFGKKKEIMSIFKINKIKFNTNINIIDPDLIRNNYIDLLVKMRKHKCLTEYDAKKLLKDNIFLATMMLKTNQIDGIVAGVNTTTANTIRPALQIIKTSPDYSIISSIFIMLLPKNVLIYGDCAINPNPNYKQLAEITIQSAETAKLFDIVPKIAMISYSTGNSSSGIEVEKVHKATKFLQNKFPDLIIDGPLQYDAAVDEKIGKYKAPNSLVAGNANIIIFPDLNTGNTTYKAVQRSSNIISIGPILQGINQPINDLSRGASVEDIIYTIAVTILQSKIKT
ncbi:phosphate acetyltransferase [Enterobacteriaceae endosymbiont of Donacia tomentosa]|uniref:phosphate acetyltransferase n=1 Tax=Enterobacteriaceae endosymbiont of Donacia tomentosa TaxID=2675787 RepID=UPI001449B9D7|nr:phosphate acetyltransferase [Enterobacteriaceae endosymbiont of Donacia tomentosa]QJC31522.1 phosphate acetyltransferase [Enterobacteriaceae endosymbiont of Donacia tomentosa]